MLHIALHVIVPVLVALAFFRRRWKHAAMLLVGTMVVDVDHLLADPIYDPERCSIGFHPLHTVFPIVLFAVLALLPWVIGRSVAAPRWKSALPTVHLVGLGLLIHMALDWGDCLL